MSWVWLVLALGGFGVLVVFGVCWAVAFEARAWEAFWGEEDA